MGKRHRPTYRIVAIESSRSRDGKYLEALGHYDPVRKLLEMNLERVEHWLSKGAQPTDTARKLIRRYSKEQKPVPEVTEAVPESKITAEAPAGPADEAAAEAQPAEAGDAALTETSNEGGQNDGTEATG